MKVTNWRRKLAATLVAGGMIAPGQARAANLDTNLVVNGTFESVDLGVTGDYGAPQVLNWMGTGFAYSHNPGVTGIPDYADTQNMVGDPPGAGLWYFTANNQPLATTGDVRTPDVVFQDIAVGTGATGTQIANGAAYRLSAYMSSYLNDNDFGIVHLQFKNAGGTTISTAQIQDTDPGPANIWSLTSGVGLIPAGTTTIRASLLGGVVNSGTDGYIDNVDMQVTDAANELLFLQVNTTTGAVTLRNQTGDPVRIDYYEVRSAGSSLNTVTWSSLQDQNLAGFPAGNGTGNGWEEAGASSATAAGESFLTGSSNVANGASVGLGGLFKTAGFPQDLQFSYSVVTASAQSSDFDSDGDSDGGDFLAWQRGFGTATGATKAQGDTDADGDVDATDFNTWKQQFGESAFSGAGTLQQGFVRYVTVGAGAVPEPGTVLLAGLGIAGVAVLGMRKR